jgi:hypothetical protein
MKIRFLSLGLVGASLLTGSVFSAKLIEIHFYLNRPSEARTTQSSRSVELIEATERISFPRGAFGETVSGVVTQSKSYVLDAKGDQYLSANLSSPNNCVAFNTGTPVLNFTTVSGDNSLTVVNKCVGTSTFSLAIEIR